MNAAEMTLTPEQRDALDALTAKQRAFVLAFVGEAAGNATAAARIAGYANPDPEGNRQMGKDGVLAAIEAMRAPAERVTIDTIEQLREFWTAVRRGELRDTIVTRDGVVLEAPAPMAVRLRASELLAKSLGAFLERREVSGPGGTPLPGAILANDPQLLALASGSKVSR